MSKMNQTHSIYFKREEMYETLHNQGQRYNPDEPLRDVNYNYKNNSNYKGQMRGGFREGDGIMTWEDGAKYDGQWKEGYACGQGIFHHADGDKYWYLNGKKLTQEEHEVQKDKVPEAFDSLIT